MGLLNLFMMVSFGSGVKISPNHNLSCKITFVPVHVAPIVNAVKWPGKDSKFHHEKPTKPAFLTCPISQHSDRLFKALNIQVNVLVQANKPCSKSSNSGTSGILPWWLATPTLCCHFVYPSFHSDSLRALAWLGSYCEEIEDPRRVITQEPSFNSGV